jgi:polysaccharide export outer membrane protein
MISRSLLLTLSFVIACTGQEQKNNAAAPVDAMKAPSQKIKPVPIPPEFINQPRFSQRHTRYEIRTNDVLELTFGLAGEFNQTLTVQPDGFVTLKDVGDMHVQGLTVPQLTAELRKAYGKILADPVVTVTLKDFEKPYFMAGGKLQKPGKYEMRGYMTLTDAVMMAGGFTDDAKHSDVLLYHRLPDDSVLVRKFNVKKALSAGVHEEEVAIEPGDMVYVPKNTSSKIMDWLKIPAEAVTVGYRF